MQTRRSFIRHTAAGSFGLFLWAERGGVSTLLAESIPGGTLDLRSPVEDDQLSPVSRRLPLRQPAQEGVHASPLGDVSSHP